MPGAEFVVVPDAAHLTENQKPAFLLRTVREFLRRVDRGPGASPPRH